jgi:3-hydroxyisobutyrate dehydrogenase
MAARLLANGHEVTVWNRTRPRAEALGRAGARVAPSPREAADGANVILAMVADDAASRATWTGESGALAGAGPGAVLIESSTLTPGWIAELAPLARARGCEFLDAPVTGSKSHAAAGELLFLVGGDAGVLERVRPVLQAMARLVVHVGPSGSGARLKLVNNFVCAVQAVAIAEAIALMERSGLDMTASLPVLLDGAPGSPLVKAVTARMTSRNYDVNFRLALMRKDVAYASAEAEQQGMRLVTAQAAHTLFTKAEAAGLGDVDFAAVVEPLRTRT